MCNYIHICYDFVATHTQRTIYGVVQSNNCACVHKCVKTLHADRPTTRATPADDASRAKAKRLQPLACLPGIIVEITHRTHVQRGQRKRNVSVGLHRRRCCRRRCHACLLCQHSSGLSVCTCAHNNNTMCVQHSS